MLKLDVFDMCFEYCFQQQDIARTRQAVNVCCAKWNEQDASS